MRKLTAKVKISHDKNHTSINVFLSGYSIDKHITENGIIINLYNYHVRKLGFLYDGIMFMFIMLAMEKYDIFQIDGPVSRKSLRNIRIFQEAWHCLMPEKYFICVIEPKKILGDFRFNLKKKDKAISAFSGGMDATFLALRHTAGNAWGFDLKHCLMVHGFDVKYDDKVTFNRLLERVNPFLQAHGLVALIAYTDIRKYELQNWEHSFAAQLAGILHLYHKNFSYALIGSSEPYNALLFPWGSTPATDYLLSGSAMDIVHEGAGYSRTQKAATVASDVHAQKTLKVCWEGADQASNCGVCEKCVRTQLNFLAVGYDRLACFPHPADEIDISRINTRNSVQTNELRSIVEYCDKNDISEVWVENLRARVEELSQEY